MQQVIEGLSIFPFSGGFMNFYLVETSDGLMLVDTGMSAAMMQQAIAQMTAKGHSVAQITRIVITHAHYDHYSGLAYLQSQCNAQTYAHPRETAIIRGELPAVFASPRDVGLVWRAMLGGLARTAAKVTPARVDTEIREGDTVIDDWQVVELPGHAYGQIGLWNPQKRALIGGDVLIHTPFGFMMPLRPATPDWAAAKRSIQKAAALNPQTLCVGHGRPIISGAGEKLAKFAARLKV